MKYQFPYQRILDVRIIEEEIKARDLAISQNKLEKMKSDLDTLQDEKEEIFENEHDNTIVTDTRSLMNQHIYLDTINNKISDQNTAIEKSKTEVDGKRDELLETSKAKDMMNKLLDADHTNFIKETDRVNQNASDEISSRIISRKSSE